MSGHGRRLAVEQVRAYRTATAALAVVMAGLGVIMTAVAAAGGGGLGLVLGPAFVGLGIGRLYLLRAGSRAHRAGRDSSASDDS